MIYKFSIDAMIDTPLIAYERMTKCQDLSDTVYYGPLLVMSNPNINVPYLTWVTNPWLKLMKDVAILIKLLRTKGITIKFIKDEISKYIVVNNQTDSCEAAKYAVAYYQNTLNTIRDVQHKDKLLESAMMDCSPIVEYQGMIKRPLMTTEDMTAYTTTNNNKLDVLGRDEMVEKSVIYSLQHNLIPILETAHEYTITCNADVFPRVADSLLKTDYEKYLVSYYILAYYMYHYQKLKDNTYFEYVSVAVKLIHDFDLNGDMQLQDIKNLLAMGDHSEDLCKATESLLDDEISNDFITDKKIENIMYETRAKLKPDTTHERNLYDLNKFTSYIYNARRYNWNKYVNSLLTSESIDGSHLTGYTYFDGFMFAEMDDKWMVTPVVDLADNYQVKLIKMDKLGKFSVEKF